MSTAAVQAIPPQYPGATPYLTIRGADRAIEFYKTAFGATQVARLPPDGRVMLADLFDGKGQLIVQHFMYGPDWNEGCPSCSFWTDNFNGIDMHLAHRDTAFVLVSRGPIGVASRSSMAPVSSPSSICMMVMPVSASPASTAAWIGAAPRQRGSRLA